MTVIEHRGIAFRRIELAACLALGERLRDGGGPWHSHVLSPGCAHNPFTSRYAIVIEDDAAGIPYIAEGTSQFPEVDKDLVRMLHGPDILDASQAKGGAAAQGSPLLAHLMALQAATTRWHHHMHFPACAINPHPGRWSISVESPQGTFSEAFAEEPRDILREVEVIYFANLARHG